MQPTQKKTFGLSQAVGIAVILFLLAAGVWTAAQFGPYLPNAFNRIGAALINLTQTFIPAQKLTVSIDQTTTVSGEKVTFSWVHTNPKKEGVYSLLYPCITGAYVGMQVTTGEKTLLCDTPSDIYSDTNSITLITVSENDGTTTIPITLSFTQIEDTEASLSATAIVTVQTESDTNVTDSTTDIKPIEPTITGTPATNPTQPVTTDGGKKAVTAGTTTQKVYPITNTKTPAPYGKTDLAPRVLEIGVINKITNEFTATSSLRVYDRIAVRFVVENLGSSASGHWQFSAVLPTFPMHIFESEGQQSLEPGDRIEYTIGFDQVEPDVDGRFVINVDPTSSIAEASESNNIATTTIRAKSN
ncbi:MAG: hypothetical protein A2664_00360 [Candidatus Taylorbacteria bacterium RIFCSPHIGHO2_01_FULL_46_22b]|uniref:CARDB domain-containing protein n=1 Tax=Candidatus Taylorbacteria bacterium RIFCSPHIGHO2_01_FULL_46_22b TaxID=1802301 RepID=A0A1G2M430_9BACT|nr:MAG: hypothetical protein A2664_00360 [Candidatus Taylorbacteria bacterium RIFCSPHIGHO2_01_FULL_46_22b]